MYTLIRVYMYTQNSNNPGSDNSARFVLWEGFLSPIFLSESRIFTEDAENAERKCFDNPTCLFVKVNMETQ